MIKIICGCCMGNKMPQHVLCIVVPHILNLAYVWGRLVYFNVFYNVNKFYVFQQELLHSPNEIYECFFSCVHTRPNVDIKLN